MTLRWMLLLSAPRRMRCVVPVKLCAVCTFAELCQRCHAQAVLDALTAAAAVPLPCDALAAPVSAPQRSPAVVRNPKFNPWTPHADEFRVHTLQDARPAKPNSKILALQAAELARKQEVRQRCRCGVYCLQPCLTRDTSQERINEERQAKKEALERQREAARRAAAQSMPTLKDAAQGDGPAKLLPRPPASGAAFPSKPGETASKALPRLKQAMEVRVLTDAALAVPRWLY